MKRVILVLDRASFFDADVEGICIANAHVQVNSIIVCA
jgi:hypothetical protein